MKRLLVLLLVTATAHAAPITPPTGWTLDASLAAPPAATRFGGATTKVTVSAYRAPAPGAVLYVNRAEAEVTAAERDRLATIELEEPRNALRRQGANAKAEQDSQRFDPALQQLEAQVKWRDPSSGVIDTTRMLIAADDKNLVAVTAQCVLAADAPPALAAACEGALATLDTEIPRRYRAPLAIVTTVVEPPPKPLPATLDDGAKIALPPMVVNQPPPPPDRRPVYLGAGIVVLAAIFWWNRKRREKFEGEHPREVPDRVPRATAKTKSRDEDADALHSAAEAGDDRENKP